jgi:hypothetical protein
MADYDAMNDRLQKAKGELLLALKVAERVGRHVREIEHIAGRVEKLQARISKRGTDA